MGLPCQRQDEVITLAMISYYLTFNAAICVDLVSGFPATPDI
jgi:hypothetical protein